MKKRKVLSDEEYRALKRWMDEHIKEHTPLSENKCYCGGEVVKKITSFFRWQFFYSLPECNTCHRMYLFAGNVRVVGEKEFREILSQPFDI